MRQVPPLYTSSVRNSDFIVSPHVQNCIVREKYCANKVMLGRKIERNRAANARVLAEELIEFRVVAHIELVAVT